MFSNGIKYFFKKVPTLKPVSSNGGGFYFYLINSFWLLFLTDAVASVIRDLDPTSPRAMALDLFGYLALLASFPIVVGVVLTQQIPKRIVVPMILFLWWSGPCMAFPMAFLDPPLEMLWISFAQLFLGMGIRVFFGRREKTWLPLNEDVAVPFRWKYTLTSGTIAAALLAIVCVLSVGSGLAVSMMRSTGGYVRLRTDGLYLTERRFVSGDQEVWLSGMMHVARKEFYSEILPTEDPKFSTIVLVEGVTDNQKLLGSKKLGYSRMADLMGISAQENSVFTEKVREGLAAKSDSNTNDGALDFRRADVDVATLQPGTIAFILAVMSLFQAEDWQKAMNMVGDTKSPLSDNAAAELAMKDLIHSRNLQLQGQIEVSLKSYRRVIVPWGAMHLPEIEVWLRDRDFQKSGQIERKALSFW